MKKILPIFVILTVIIAGASFYGGMKYGQSKNSLFGLAGRDFSEMAGGQNQRFLSGNATGTFQRMAGDFLSGEIIAKDEQSLTIKTADGGSKIVFFSGSTQIIKTTEGSVEDIAVGEQVTITGQQNSDGSYTAQTIQER